MTTESGIPSRPVQYAEPSDALVQAAAGAQTLEDLSELLRGLRRRHARNRRDSSLTYRELAGRTGWSTTSIAQYFTAHTLPPTDRFEALLEVLGAGPAERRALANARDRVEETQYRARNQRTAGSAPAAADPACGPDPDSAKNPDPRMTVVPRQLPAAPRMFTGRAHELTRLDAALDAQPATGRTLAVSAIGGAGGVGKTWLALHWAHHNLHRFPDGQLYVNLRGYDPSGRPLAPSLALRGFLEALGASSRTLPSQLEALIGLYRSLTADKHMLIVLDNARDADQVTPLLPGSPTCTVLITSRHPLGALTAAHGARALDLDVLPEPDARHVLLAHLGSERLAAEPRATDELLASCAGLPLALSITAARAERHPAVPLAALADELRDQSERLDALDLGGPQTSLRAVLSWSAQALSPDAMAGFALLSLATGPDIALPAAASLLDQPIAAARALLRELEDASLLQQPAPGRYRMHDLVRLYAADHAERDHTSAGREKAVRRVLDFYTRAAYDADRVLNPHRRSALLDPPTPGAHSSPPPDVPSAVAWFDAEHANLLAAQRTAAGQEWHDTVWHLAWALSTFHRRKGRVHDMLAVWRAALEAAEHLPDPTARPLAHRNIGLAYAELGRHQQAIEQLHHALAGHHADPTGQAHTHQELALAWARQGDDRQALEHAIRALDICRNLDEPIWQADAFNAVGWFAARLGEYDTARTHCQAALALYRRNQHAEGEAATLDSLGYIEQHTDGHRQAIEHYQRALTLRRNIGNTYSFAGTLDSLGHPHVALGQHQQARTAWQQAMELYQEQGRYIDAARVRRQLATLDEEGAGKD